MDLGLENKRVFITASSRGIGLATARAFLDEGARVVLNGRNEDKLRALVSGGLAEYGERVSYVAADVQTDEGAEIAESFLERHFGGLDVFVSNLGSGKPEDRNALAQDEWRRFYDVNVLSGVRMLGRLYPLLKKAEEATVVLVSSVVAKEAAAAPAGYAAAKSAICTLNKYLSRMWADDGIRVNCVLPGNIYFEGGRWEELKNADESATDAYISTAVPMKRFGTPNEVADAITFLASQRAGFITGAELVVDGGQMGKI